MASAGEWEKCLEYIGDGTENSDEYLAQQQVSIRGRRVSRSRMLLAAPQLVHEIDTLTAAEYARPVAVDAGDVLGALQPPGTRP